MPANSGVAAEVPPMGYGSGLFEMSVGTLFHVLLRQKFGSHMMYGSCPPGSDAAKAKSGTSRVPPCTPSSACQLGFGNTALTPPPVASPIAPLFEVSFHAFSGMCM